MEGKTRNLYGDKLLGKQNLVLIQATFGAAGAVTRDAANSSPDTTITLDTTGDYDITFPKCEGVHVVGCHLDNGDDTPDAADAFVAAPVGLSASAGTGKVLICATDDGLVSAPDSGGRLYVTLICRQN